MDSSKTTHHEIVAAAASPASVHHQSGCDTAVNLPNVDSAATSSSVEKSKKCSIFFILIRVFIFMLHFYLCILGSIVLVPLLVVSYLLLRLLQFIRQGRDYNTVTQLKHFIRIWMYIFMATISFMIGIIIIVFHNKHRSYVTAVGDALSSVPYNPYWLYLFMAVICYFSVMIPNTISLITTTSLPLMDHNGSVSLNLREGVVEIIDCLLLWWVDYEFMKHVPAFKHHKIHGLHTYNWIMVFLFVIIGYDVIKLSTHIIVWKLRSFVENLNPGFATESPRFLFIEKVMRRHYLMYCANGIKHNINFILTTLLLLLTWVLYFDSHLNKTPQSKLLLEFGTWTCVSSLVCSLLWLIKTCVLLSWEAYVVYSRFRREILVGGKQLYFLGIIGRHSHDIFNLLYDAIPRQREDNLGMLKSVILRAYSMNKKFIAMLTCKADDAFDEKIKQRIGRFFAQYLTSIFVVVMRPGDSRKSGSDIVDDWATQILNKNKVSDLKVWKLSSKLKERVEDDLLIEDGHISTMYSLQQVAQYLLTARNTLLKECYTSDIRLHLDAGSKDGILEQKFLKQIIEGEDKAYGQTDQPSRKPRQEKVQLEWENFQNQLHKNSENIGEWMDRASNNCLFLANALSSSKETADCLNKIISWLIIAVTFIMWLFLTGLATTKILVLIASPVLAATFIFGDTCKTIFQGIIFIYVVQPFDVGDLCVIDDKMMEVRTIGVWKTTFSKVGTQEEVIYTNSELSNKNIINHRTDFDWNDYVELDVTSLNKENIMNLQDKVKRHLDHDEIYKPGHNCVALLTSGENVKIAISFRHNNANSNDRNYSKCLKAKREQQSLLVLFVYDLVENMKKNETPKTSEKTTKQAKGKMVLETKSSDD